MANTYAFGAPFGGALGTSAADLHTASGTVERITQLAFCNTGASTRLVTLYYTPSGGSDRVILSAEPLLAGETLNAVALLGELHLSSGDKLRAKQDSGTDVNYHGSRTVMT